MSYRKPARAFVYLTPETILERPDRPTVVIPITPPVTGCEAVPNLRQKAAG